MSLRSKLHFVPLVKLINPPSIPPCGDDIMKKTLVAIAFGALLTGCEEPKFEGELDTYAPACENKPYVEAGFFGYSIECGEYHFEYFENESECTSVLQQESAGCVEKWMEGNCDGALDYWSKSCPVYDEEGVLISNTNEYSRLPTEAQNQQFKDKLLLIGQEAARQVWIEWNAE